MHPASAFRWQDEAALSAFVAEHAFAQICIARDGHPLSAQAPLSFHEGGTIRFHLSRGNPLVPVLDGAAVLAGVIGEHFYVSPDWYGTPDQVPTWNYRLVEIEGIARRLDPAELAAQVDELSATHEARLAPKPAWTSAKMSPSRLRALLAGIVGFEIVAPTLRGAAKLGQNKSPDEAAGAIAALHALGRTSAAQAMAAVR